MNEQQQRDLTKAICQMLLPLVSPYDLSEKQMWNQYHNNPYFARSVAQVFHLVTDSPITLAKVLNDMKIMKELCL